ncbi:MAG TPA: DUF4332 domain-containing protein [Candidatus Lokiarchaeia archaeon]|nr:DUF4332 domain-containing protein [Candidatus Lokiarchaeia archaeon]
MVKFKFDIFEDIGSFYGKTLKRKANLETIDDFLKETSYGMDYKPLLAKLNAPEEKPREIFGKERVRDHPEIDEKRLVRWGRIFDLFRIPRMPPRIAEMLVAADVNSVAELSYMDPTQILFKMQEVDEDTHFIIIEEPRIADAEEWIYYAKLMTRRKKYGMDIPLVNVIPVMNLDFASELQKYKIWTMEDLDANFGLIPGLYDRIGMPRLEYVEILGICDLCRVHGIDIAIARALHEIGIRSLLAFQDASINEACENLKKAMITSYLYKQYPTLERDLTRSNLEQLQNIALSQKIKTFLEAMA